MKFRKYLFTPGFVLLLVQTLVIAALCAMGFMLGGWPKAACTILGIWFFCFVAYVLATALRYARYRDFGKDATD